MKMITALTEMHTEMAFRDNASSTIIRAMAQLGKPLNDALAAGLLTLDTIHAPIRAACEFWTAPGYLSRYTKVPGFGSSWYKKEPDPVVEQFINNGLPPESVIKMDELQEEVSDHFGKLLFPNAALATAAAADVLDIAPFMAMSLVIEGRLSAWCDIYQRAYIDRGF